MSADSPFLAFTRVRFQSVFELQQVWSDRPQDHLPLNENALRRFRDTLEQTVSSANSVNPLGLCFVGQAGSGKTHLLGEVRRIAAENGLNFVLSDLTDVRDFWPLLAMHYLQSLSRRMNGAPQIQRILEVFLHKAPGNEDPSSLLSRIRSMPRNELVSFANDILPSLRPVYGRELTARLRTFRAILYLESDDFELSERAYSFLQGIEQIDDESKRIYLSGPNSPKRVAVDLAWFFSLCGTTVLAFDQLDPFVAQNNLADLQDSSSERLKEALHVLLSFIGGIMTVREEFAKTLIVMACLESTWKVLQQRAVSSFFGRFQEVETLQPIRDQETPRELIGKRLDEAYRAAGFRAPYPTFPFLPEFFGSMPPGLTPREILNRCEEHRLVCVRAGKVIELGSYSGVQHSRLEPTARTVGLDAKYKLELATSEPSKFLDPNNEDLLGKLFSRAAKLLRKELPKSNDIDVEVDDDFQEAKAYRSLHLRLRRIFHKEGEREEHVCVRVLLKTHAVAFQVRLNAALTISGMSEKLEGRRLVLFRNAAPPSGKVTADMVQRARTAGAEFVALKIDDLRVLTAVVALSESKEELFETWLLQHRPLSRTTLFASLIPTWLGAPVPPLPSAPQPAPKPQLIVSEPDIQKPILVRREESRTEPASRDNRILLGNRMEGGTLGEVIYMPPVDLTRHVILRAGSGGGKTVFIKRLIEEAALCGVSSIVIDTAKDLSLLGDRWNPPPLGWSAADAKRAAQYHRDVDVQIWTPGHSGGRPMRLAPLPNLSGPFEELHDRDQAVEIAVAGVLPLAVKRKSTAVEKAILKKVVEWLTRQAPHTGNELERLVSALRDLPAEAFQGYQNERKLAAAMADQIQATIIGDPLYGAKGDDLDPALLFGVSGRRARVSVLSLFAMPDIATQARFIGQLASVLFNWIRRHPAPSGAPARGMLVLDEAARFLPRNNAESKPGLMLLAQQARKYGLGLVLATQNPMDLDYNAAANFATQFFGTANVPQVVKFIEEAMEQKGLRGLNPGQLKAGQFFCATPSLDRPVRLHGRMCLSAHPHNVQLSDDDILERARNHS